MSDNEPVFTPEYQPARLEGHIVGAAIDLDHALLLMAKMAGLIEDKESAAYMHSIITVTKDARKHLERASEFWPNDE